MNLSPRIAFFSQSDMELMRNKTFILLEDHGVKMDHEEMMKLLERAGARVDYATQMVRFPRKFLEEQLDKAPRAFSLVGRDGKHEMKFPREDGTFHTRTNTGAQSWIEPETGRYRRVTIADVETWAHLVDRLDNIGFAAFPVPSDVPSQTADVHALRAMLKNMEKHIWIQPYTGETVEYLVRLCVAAAGGEDALRKNPLADFITCSLTPLEFKWMDLEIILQSARFGIPMQPCSLPGAGATGPITTPGVALLAAAENLVMLAASQVVQPGLPIIPTSLQFSADMRSGRSLQSTVEAMRQSALFVQFMKQAFGFPAHTYASGADSPTLDAQCMTERALQALLIAHSGGDVLGAAGQLEVATTISPVQLIIDNEVFGMVRGIITQMAFGDEEMAWEALMNIKSGGEFLTHAHTLRHCRDGIKPVNFTRDPRDVWEQKGSLDLIDRATENYKDLVREASPLDLPEDVVRELDAIVNHADSKLSK